MLWRVHTRPYSTSVCCGVLVDYLKMPIEEWMALEREGRRRRKKKEIYITILNGPNARDEFYVLFKDGPTVSPALSGACSAARNSFKQFIATHP